MSVPKCLFFQDLEGLTEVFGRMSAGISGQKLPLWAEFSFLKSRSENRLKVGFGAEPPIFDLLLTFLRMSRYSVFAKTSLINSK